MYDSCGGKKKKEFSDTKGLNWISHLNSWTRTSVVYERKFVLLLFNVATDLSARSNLHGLQTTPTTTTHTLVGTPQGNHFLIEIVHHFHVERTKGTTTLTITAIVIYNIVKKWSHKKRSIAYIFEDIFWCRAAKIFYRKSINKYRFRKNKKG